MSVHQLLRQPSVRNVNSLPGVQLVRLSNQRGLRVLLSSLGASVLSVRFPDIRGKSRELVLRHPRLQDYCHNATYFGATIGRVCNRIAQARYRWAGAQMELMANEGVHQLHGGPEGLSRKNWQLHAVTPSAASFVCRSAAGDQGFPGKLWVQLTVALDDHNRLHFDYQATTDQPTPVALTNHTYWTMGARHIGELALNIAASRRQCVDAELIPTGDLVAVDNTAFDLRKLTRLDQVLAQQPEGIDHAYLLDKGSSTSPEPVARLRHAALGIDMLVGTTEPSVQCYTGNFLNATPVARGRLADINTALCLEAQALPNAINGAHPEQVMLLPGETYRQHTWHQFLHCR